MVQHVPKCIYLYILMKVINYCSISYCNCTYLLNNPILAHAFGLRLLATYEDVNMCMTEMGCNSFSTYLLVHVLYARITDLEMLRPPPTENTRLLHIIYMCIYHI